MTDNSACYKSRRFRRLLKRLGLRHLRTRPYTPRTNGKAERLVQTALREWAYARQLRTARFCPQLAAGTHPKRSHDAFPQEDRLLITQRRRDRFSTVALASSEHFQHELRM